VPSDTPLEPHAASPSVVVTAPLSQPVSLLSLIARNRLALSGAILALLLTLMAILAEVISPYDPMAVNVRAALQAPSRANLFGTDRFGRDLLTRVVYGARVSLGIAFASVAVAMLVGSLLGLFGAYVGGSWDTVLGRVMDVLFSFPLLLLAIAIVGMLGPGIPNAIIAITIVYTPFFFRVARGPTLAEREKEYVQAAKAVGAGSARILWRHLLPNLLSPIVVQGSVTIAYAILTEASLSYLGLGTPLLTPSWGTTLNEGRTYLQLAPWISIFPGIAIMLAVLAFNLLGDGLRDALDPHLK